MTYPLAMKPRNRLRQLRKAAGLSQAELAARTGVSQPAISQLENDVIAMDTGWMRAFARELDCTPADLLADEDNPDRLSDEERALIHSFREANAVQREMVLRVAAPAQAAYSVPEPPRSRDGRKVA